MLCNFFSQEVSGAVRLDGDIGIVTIEFGPNVFYLLDLAKRVGTDVVPLNSLVKYLLGISELDISCFRALASSIFLDPYGYVVTFHLGCSSHDSDDHLFYWSHN